jgi:DNA polymerase III subunit delta'
VPGFDAIIDQERPIRILASFLKHGTIPHALLFTGIEGVGKRTAAVAFAMACNCTGDPLEKNAADGAMRAIGRPCGECAPCRKISAGLHPDVLRVDPHGLLIKIDQVRELCQLLALRPYEARVRVVVIADAHRLNVAAGNALLKILEEPPEGTVLILTAPQTADVLPTIASRCRQLRFKPIAREHLSAILERAYGFSPEEASLTAAMANGSVTRALAMQHSHWIRRRDWFISELAALPRQPIAWVLAVAERMSQVKEEIPDYLEMAAAWVRDVAVARHDPDRIIHQNLRTEILAAAHRMDERFVGLAARDLADTQRRIQAHANARLSLEALLIRLSAAMRSGRSG